jgi:hypothetical protein
MRNLILLEKALFNQTGNFAPFGPLLPYPFGSHASMKSA